LRGKLKLPWGSTGTHPLDIDGELVVWVDIPAGSPQNVFEDFTNQTHSVNAITLSMTGSETSGIILVLFGRLQSPDPRLHVDPKSPGLRLHVGGIMAASEQDFQRILTNMLSFFFTLSFTFEVTIKSGLGFEIALIAMNTIQHWLSSPSNQANGVISYKIRQDPDIMVKVVKLIDTGMPQAEVDRITERFPGKILDVRIVSVDPGITEKFLDLVQDIRRRNNLITIVLEATLFPIQATWLPPRSDSSREALKVFGQYEKQQQAQIQFCLAVQRSIAFCSGQHVRMGDQSIVGTLSEDLIKLIFQKGKIIPNQLAKLHEFEGALNCEDILEERKPLPGYLTKTGNGRIVCLGPILGERIPGVLRHWPELSTSGSAIEDPSGTFMRISFPHNTVNINRNCELTRMTTNGEISYRCT
jgi:hypothetical protein